MGPGFVRIIGGKWRGRRLNVLASADLRPTPDRVRETLFNWLAPYLPSARCLDLFAGSGVLGFEALSRGAKGVTMIDQSSRVVASLQASLAMLIKNEPSVVAAGLQASLATPTKNDASADVEFYCAKVPEELQKPKNPFDIVFMDPPYRSSLISPCALYLEQNDFLADSALIYLESAAPILANDLPAHWRILKAKKAGSVYYHLAQRNG